MNSGTSLPNRKSCDEIIQQFLDIDFDESMLVENETHEDHWDASNLIFIQSQPLF